MYKFILVAGACLGYEIYRRISDYNAESYREAGGDGGTGSSDRRWTYYGNNSSERTNGAYQNWNRGQSQPSSSSRPPRSSSEPLSSSNRTSTSSPNPPPSSIPPQSSSELHRTSTSSPNPPPSSNRTSASSPNPPPSSRPPQSSSELHRTSTSSPNPPPSSNRTSTSSPNPPPSSNRKSPSTPNPPPSSRPPQSSSELHRSSTSSPNLPPFSFEPSPSSSGPNSCRMTLSPVFSDLDDQEMIFLETGTSPIYKIPKDIEDLIKKDIVPGVLKIPLSPSTYKDYFSTLLYAEDFYIEKWNDFKLENVTLELQKGTIYKTSGNNRYINERDESDDKIFVVFEVENIPEKRPFLLSRDFVFARPSGMIERFQGILYRMESSTRVLVEFGEDFHYQHCAASKYDVSFSFNRVCLKRAHQAIAAVSDSTFRNFIFPNNLSRKNIPTSPHSLSFYHALDQDQKSAVFQILSFRGPPAYLVQGPLCVKQTPSYSKDVSRTGLVVQEAVLQIYRSTPESRILICAPLNKTCDVLMKSLNKDIFESDMFRANAAFRELDRVPIDVLPYCPYERECFVCPPLRELKKFRVILSTFVSCFRLHNEGITAGHFTHIFLVDTSSATEPEAMVALSNLADEKTVVVVTGAPGNRSGWVRSDIARRHGLKKSYFERLLESNPYSSLDSSFITQLGDY